MKSILVKDLMVPLRDCDRLDASATLYEAVLALEKAFSRPHPGSLPHRTLLVVTPEQGVVGLIGYLDILRGLEPKYKGLLERQGMAHLGFTRKLIQSMLSQYSLWEHPLDDICRKAAAQHVSDFAYIPREDEFIREDATLDEAVHQLVMGSFQSLLVTHEDATTGILRLSDVFEAVADSVKACQLDR